MPTDGQRSGEPFGAFSLFHYKILRTIGPEHTACPCSSTGKSGGLLSRKSWFESSQGCIKGCPPVRRESIVCVVIIVVVMGTCAGTNKDGTSCSNAALDGSRYCHVHQGAEGRSADAHAEDEYSFGTMLAGALAVSVVTYFLLRIVLGV